MNRFATIVLSIALSPSLAVAQQSKGELPKVLLLGDSIRMGYAPLVAKSVPSEAFQPKLSEPL